MARLKDPDTLSIPTIVVYKTDFCELEATKGAGRLLSRLDMLAYTASGSLSRSRQGKAAWEWLRTLERSINRQAREAWERGEMPDRLRLDDDLEPVVE